MSLEKNIPKNHYGEKVSRRCYRRRLETDAIKDGQQPEDKGISPKINVVGLKGS